ncbi:uncharacterized protein TRAVEDRAFT_24850 [Trametes versicolor FP-101664 SS1]|uniref:Uncharacterized protein n=1 Tax=Trametes versicolor (strain FP-101664) TaxID=717944 RepID=R7S7U2_TRAVS|nr:uncharacterized protein TRAVEDRAFT_24850 [Trametes versicolor FP-101664 SS1]EIW51755.1 hypothetical protein TRAVEDRAFT_24850 [Trametes versicolor FP-101664 SS1]
MLDETIPSATTILSDHNIPYAYWYEHALHYYGSKTVVFSIHLLVKSARDAEACLRNAGWQAAAVPQYAPQYYDPAIDKQVVLDYPGAEETTVVLLSVYTWPGITLSVEADSHYPTLPEMYNALAQRFLDTDCLAFRQYLNIQLGYLYEDCVDLASSDFLARLPTDIQQFHLDWRSGTLWMDTTMTLEHERRIRERVRRGDWQLMPQGSAALGGSKADRDFEARLSAEANKANEWRASS